MPTSTLRGHGSFVEVLSALEVSAARRIAASVLPVAPEKTTGQLRDMLRRKALAADPAYVTARRKQAEASRSVQLHAADDGIAALTAFGLDAARASAAFARIGAIARARHAAGTATGGTLEQIRADVFLELLEGKHSSAPAGVIQLEVSVETLAGLNKNPGKLGSFGPVAADIARQIARSHRDAQW
ncbi:hypothetical protein [Catelliglobosispora koreensis]|uniref:hypothetical protein n=1 Tax=Catelliglobosispora koreensis TaxID=129052 RepID=UPI00039DB4B4|nr:hypothetical protein [Catelliglobosispora koreensis]